MISPGKYRKGAKPDYVPDGTPKSQWILYVPGLWGVAVSRSEFDKWLSENGTAIDPKEMDE
jgi:hypothetical protein